MVDDNSKGFIGAVQDEWQLYSDNPEDYTLGPPIGFGASSIVYTAIYNPKSNPSEHPIPCALKVLDLDSLPAHSLRLLKRETTLMSLSKHPNVLRVRGSWMDGHKLHIALRLMSKGSAADVMHYGWPCGMDEEVVRCILKQALEGLNYLHINGFIHRDVKAANMLIDDDGTVLLGDLGVAANLADDTDQQHPSKRTANYPHPKPPRMGKRKSFVGTPCWMAPEIIQGKQYDSSADIWSFGITALELTQGRPPRSRETPQKVLLKTVRDAPPTLDRNSGEHKYSRTFKETIESCLNKDPTCRPTAAQLLATPFFRAAKKKSFLVGPNGILTGLPPLTQRLERRATIAPTQMVKTMDSWDFMTTVARGRSSRSPTGSVSDRSPTTSIVGLGRGLSVRGHRQNSTGSIHGHRPSPTTSSFGPSLPTVRCVTVDSEAYKVKDKRMFEICDDVGVTEDREAVHLRSISWADHEKRASGSPKGTEPDRSPLVCVSAQSPSSDPAGELDSPVEPQVIVGEATDLAFRSPTNPEPQSTSSSPPLPSHRPPSSTFWRKLIQGQPKATSNTNDGKDAKPGVKQSMIARKAQALVKMTGSASPSDRER